VSDKVWVKSTITFHSKKEKLVFVYFDAKVNLSLIQ